MKPPKPEHGRLLRLGVVAAGFAVFLTLFIPSWVYATLLVGANCAGPHTGLEGAETVSFTSRDGPTLRGWFTEGSTNPEVAVIVIPGGAANTSAALLNASIVAEAGFSTLVYEHRTCADPSLQMTAGYREADDLLGAVDYLLGRPDVEHIAVVGFSAGGTAALLAAPQSEHIGAVIAMGGFSSMRNDIFLDEERLTAYERLTRHLVAFNLTIKMGVPPRAVAPVDVIEEIAPRPVLLIYGEHEAFHGRALYEAASDPSELWIVPGANHGGYERFAPEEYPIRIQEFLREAFSAILPPQHEGDS